MKHNSVSISIALKPGARKDYIEINDDGAVRIAVTSPAIEGRANEHLIKLLSKALHISKSSCSIIRGAKSRHKVVAVAGIGREEIADALKNSVNK